MPRANIDTRTLLLPERLYKAFVHVTARVLNIEERSAREGLGQLFAGMPSFGDLFALTQTDLEKVFPGTSPLLLRALVIISAAFTPTTPVCEHCGDAPLSEIGGTIRCLDAGSACPFCREGIVEIVPMTLARLNWVTGSLENAGVRTDFHTVRGKMIPLDNTGLVSWAGTVDPHLLEACETSGLPLYGALALANLKRGLLRRPEEGEWFLQDPSSYGIRTPDDLARLVRDALMFLDEREVTNLPYHRFLSNGQLRENFWPIRIGEQIYLVEGQIAEGDKCLVLRGFWDHTPTAVVVIKLLDDPAEKDLFDAELRNLALLAKSQERGSEVLKPTVPILVTSGVASLPNGERFHAMVYRYQHGRDWTLKDVMDAYSQGVSGRTLVWMFNRLLLQMSWWHDTGLIHAGLVPEHLIIHPRDHLMNVIGWDLALRRGQVQQHVLKGRRPFYPPEVIEGRPVSEYTDIAMACRVMIAVSGGNPETGQIPSRFDPRIADLLRVHACYSSDQTRGSKAMDLYRTMVDTARAVYGPRKYHPFNMPPTTEQVLAEGRS